MKLRATRSEIPRHRFPIDEWRLVETEPSTDDLGLTETLFAIGNGYLGMRANPAEGRDACAHGTFINGFHETWDIHHAEAAHAFAKTGQTIINVPDAKLMKLYVDDEPLLLENADLLDYERAVDFKRGISYRNLTWRTPSAKVIRVQSERMVSMEFRHLAIMKLTLTLEKGIAPIVVSSQLLDRQDGEDEYHVPDAALGEGDDPRKARVFDKRVLEPDLQRFADVDSPDGGRVTLGYRAANSKMTIACAYDHRVRGDVPFEVETSVDTDCGKTVFSFEMFEGQTITITKFVSYHTSRGVPTAELADRCDRTLERAINTGADELYAQQQRWMDEFWAHSDIEIAGNPEDQQAVRWNLFQLAQASARTNENGIAAKSITGAGYDGHYFWDTEVYVLPFLAYTNPEAARKLLRFRYRMLPLARERANELSQVGALYPWRTISGEEASAYYAAGTAQYHINAAVAFALERYAFATGDLEFMAAEGAEILVEMARLYEDLGFYQSNGDSSFHIHRVTGPDEYTTVVNDNTYTNIMARFTMRYAMRSLKFLKEAVPEAYEALRRRTGVDDEEINSWERAAEAMYIPYDEELGIYPQDEAFLALEPWDFEGTPPEKYPLLLNYHPLVIYRHQVLKQADVVLAMFLRRGKFDLDAIRRNFDYYDPLTTGDSSLSACVQAIVAAQVGYRDLAWKYFQQSLYLDLADTHGNTADGVHVANAGGVWAAIVYGFAGMVDNGRFLSFSPQLPDKWDSVRFRLKRHGCDIDLTMDADGLIVHVLSGNRVQVKVGDEVVPVAAEGSVTIPAANRDQAGPASNG